MVVASGGGFMGWRVLGKRVACVGKGLWAQYAVMDAKHCLPLDDDLSFEDAASAFVNPLTVLAMLDVAKSGGHHAIVHTAAASALGRMLVRASVRARVPLVCLVRREEQEALLRAEVGVLLLLLHLCSAALRSARSHWSACAGCRARHQHVRARLPRQVRYHWRRSPPRGALSAPLRGRLRELAEQLQATVAYEAVAGAMTGEVLSCMPDNSVVHVYGALSGQPSGPFDPRACPAFVCPRLPALRTIP